MCSGVCVSVKNKAEEVRSQQRVTERGANVVEKLNMKKNLYGCHICSPSLPPGQEARTIFNGHFQQAQ